MAEEWSPELVLGVTALVPADYVPEPELRLELTAGSRRCDTD